MSSCNGFEVSVKEYAEQRGKTVQAVYQQMKRKENASRLNGHVVTRQVGNREVKYLDEEAVSILDKGSGSAPNIIVQDDLKAELEATEAERKRWEAQAFMLQGKIDLLKEQLDKKDEKLLLLGEPQRQIDALEKEKGLLEGFIRDAKEEINALEVEKADLKLEKDKAIQEASEAKKTAQEASDELEAAKGRENALAKRTVKAENERNEIEAELEEYEAEVEAYAELPAWKRLFVKPPKRKNKEKSDKSDG